jgi:polar amino acid transport system substrate-binding protein
MLSNFVCASPRAQTHLKFCFEDEVQFPWTKPDGSGLTIELLKRVEERLGERFEFIAKPWKRCQEEVSNGLLDGYFGAAFSEERQQFSVYPHLPDGKIDVDSALHIDQTRIFLRRDTAVTWDGKNLLHVNKPILVQRGYLIGNILSKQGYKIREVRTVHEGLGLLAAGEAEVAILPGFEAQFLVQQDLQFKKNLQIHPLTYTSLPLYLAISRHRYQRDAKRFDAIWNAIKSVRNSASYQQEVDAIYVRLKTDKSSNVK